MAKRSTRHIIKRIGLYFLLATIALLMVGPFLWMLATSLKSPGEMFAFPLRLVPHAASAESYNEVVRRMPFLLFVFNSFKIASLATVGQILSCSLAAYAFARMKFKAKEFIYFVLLATMMIPSQVTMIPVFLVMKFLGWIDTHYALFVPAFFGGAFGTFLLRQFFSTIPQDLEDAARIDGCGRFRLYWQIFMPLSKPAIATLAIFSFMGYWNDLLNPVIYLSSLEKMTLTVGLATLQGAQGTMLRYNVVMAGAVISVLPILALYIAAQKWFVRGITMTGLKG
ncbi:MAG: carbohydrate ABC transporter permease [Bacteroidota bacterium]